MSSPFSPPPFRPPRWSEPDTLSPAGKTKTGLVICPAGCTTGSALMRCPVHHRRVIAAVIQSWDTTWNSVASRSRVVNHPFVHLDAGRMTIQHVKGPDGKGLGHPKWVGWLTVQGMLGEAAKGVVYDWNPGLSIPSTCSRSG